MSPCHTYLHKLSQPQQLQQQHQQQQRRQLQQQHCPLPQQAQQQHPPRKLLNKNPNSVLRRTDTIPEFPYNNKPVTPLGADGNERNKEPRVLRRPPYIFTIAQREREKEENRQNEEIENDDMTPNCGSKCKVC